MLIKADDRLVPEFLKALSETNQQHVADILVGKRLNMFFLLFLLTGLHVLLSSFFDTQTPISQIAQRRFVKTLSENSALAYRPSPAPPPKKKINILIKFAYL